MSRYGSNELDNNMKPYNKEDLIKDLSKRILRYQKEIDSLKATVLMSQCDPELIDSSDRFTPMIKQLQKLIESTKVLLKNVVEAEKRIK